MDDLAKKALRSAWPTIFFSLLGHLLMEQYLLGELLFGQLPLGLIELGHCGTKIVNHFGNVKTYSDEENSGREQND